MALGHRWSASSASSCPSCPGTILVLGAIFVWAVEVGTGDGLGDLRRRRRLPGRRRGREVRRPRPPAQGRRRPARRSSSAALLAVVGFFVIPVVGPVRRVPARGLRRRARPGRRRRRLALHQGALRALGVSILIELAAGRPRHGRVGRRRRGHLTAVLLALLGGRAYGVSDFVGGISAKRASAWAVAARRAASAARRVLVLALLDRRLPHRRRPRVGRRSPASAPASAPRSSTAGWPPAGWASSPRSRRSVPAPPGGGRRRHG